MLRDRNIAFFIDVDNVGLKSENYNNVIEQLNAMGTIVSGKVYGAGERKHKEIYSDAELHGYRIERPMRVKRRGRKEFDPRIYVDVVDVVARTPAIDAVCVIAQPTDLVYLYSYLRSRGIKIIALDNADDASCAFIDEVIDLGIVFELKLPQTPKAKPVAVEAAPQSTPQAQGVDRTDELLREIERLRAEVPAEPVAEQPVEEPAPRAEEAPAEVQSEERPSEEEHTASIVDETRSLLERIAEMRGEQQKADEQPIESPVEQEVVEQATEPAEEQQPESPIEAQQPEEPSQEQPAEPQGFEPVAQEDAAEEPAPRPARAPLSTSNDSDLIKRIEEIRRNSQGGDEDFVEEIRKLLDGLE